MDAQVETIEARLRSFLSQLQSEVGVLDRILHKNKNQHRRSSYFHYLLKVRRYCKLLQSTNLDETVKSAFLVINGDPPKQLLESLKRRKCDGGKHNFLVRLQGAARLLSQMLEPMLKAAMYYRLLSRNQREICTLLARSFFIGFSTTVLALLARLRVLTQQILLDVVSIFNMVSTRKQQAIKLNDDGIEVFRGCYPTNEQALFLECVWETDNFILLEKKSEPETLKDDVMCQGLSTVMYQSIETILGDNNSADIVVDKKTPEKDTAIMKMDNLSSMEGLTSNCKQVDNQSYDSGVSEPSSKKESRTQRDLNLN